MYKPYTNERFDRLSGQIDAMAKGILEGKKLVYSPDEDRLEDFHFVAKVLGIRPAQVAAVYLLKHVQSVTVMVRNQDYRWYSDGGREGIMEKVADIINLAKLLLACVDEEREADMKAGLEEREVTVRRPSKEEIRQLVESLEK